MAYQKPRGEGNWRGRPQSAVEEDGRRLEALKAYLPDVGDYVRGHVASLSRASLLEALGCDPAEIATHLMEVLGGDKARAFGDRVAKVLDASDDTANPAADADFVGKESTRAEIEVLRAWVNLVVNRASGGRDVLILENGLPAGPEGEPMDPPSALIDALSLNNAQVSEIYKGFFRNLASAAAAGPVALPRDLKLVADAGSLVVKRTDEDQR